MHAFDKSELEIGYLGRPKLTRVKVRPRSTIRRIRVEALY